MQANIKEVKGQKAFRIARSKEFECYSMSDVYRKISAETNIDFTTVIEFLDCMPTFLNGQAHKERRAQQARTYADRRRTATHRCKAHISSVVGDLKSHWGGYDVLNQLARPLWLVMAEELLPIGISYKPEMDILPDLFLAHTPLTRRKKCEAFLKELTAYHGYDSLTDIALVTLGARPFVNALSTSVYVLAKRNHGKTFAEIEYPSYLPMPGLSYLHRVAASEDPLVDPTIQKGMHFKCVIHDDTYPEEVIAKNQFGVGAHVCIGRQIALAAWRSLCSELSEIDKRIAPGEIEIVSAAPFENVVTCCIEVGSD